MKKTEYLYGVKPTDLCNMTYNRALQFKLASAHKLLVQLVEEDKHLSTRADAVHKAIIFTEKLLEELRE